MTMSSPQITDVPLTDQERLVTALFLHIGRELFADVLPQGLLDEATVLKARLLGPDLKLPIEQFEEMGV